MEKTFENTERSGVATDVDWKKILDNPDLSWDAELRCVKCGKRWVDNVNTKTRLKDIRCGL